MKSSNPIGSWTRRWPVFQRGHPWLTGRGKRQNAEIRFLGHRFPPCFLIELCQQCCCCFDVPLSDSYCYFLVYCDFREEWVSAGYRGKSNMLSTFLLFWSQEEAVGRFPSAHTSDFAVIEKDLNNGVGTAAPSSPLTWTKKLWWAICQTEANQTLDLA